MAQKKVQKETQYFMMKGELVFNGSFNTPSTTKFDKNQKIRFSIKNPSFQNGDDDVTRLVECYKDVTSVFAPKFLTEGIGEYFNFKTSFPVPVVDASGNDMPDADINSHALCYLQFKVNVDGNSAAIYPVDIKVVKNADKKESALAKANW